MLVHRHVNCEALSPENHQATQNPRKRDHACNNPCEAVTRCGGRILPQPESGGGGGGRAFKASTRLTISHAMFPNCLACLPIAKALFGTLHTALWFPPWWSRVVARTSWACAMEPSCSAWGRSGCRKKIRAEVRQLWILNVTVLACEEAT